MNPQKTKTTDPMTDSKVIPADSCIYVAGHTGMVGSAIVGLLQAHGYTDIVMRSRAQLDLTEQGAVRDFFQNQKIDAVVLAAARVGGIHANNSYPAEFIYQNLVIQSNVIHEAYRAGVERLLFLGSSCIYPKLAPQPMREEYLLSGYLEPTNEPYALAKIAGIKLCESYNRQYGTQYRSVMPTNLYGPHDNFDLETSHVLPAMIRKFHLAKLAVVSDWQAIEIDEKRFGLIPHDIYASLRALSEPGQPDSTAMPSAVRLWGSGSPRREFLHVDDLAAGCLFLMNLPNDQYNAACNSVAADREATADASHVINFLNIGSGHDLMIKELAETVKSAIGYAGDVVWDRSKPDGTPRKLLDIARLKQLGWKLKIDLPDGIQQTYQWYLEQSAI
jgi:GDP-L-fucose synthase